MYYLNKMMNHLSNWFEYAKEHLLRIITILIVVVIVGYSFTLFPKENIMEKDAIVEQHILILGITLDNWFTYISLVGLFFTAIWAIYQFDKNISRKQQEKGAEIAKDFSNGLLLKCEIVNTVYKLSPLNKILKLNCLDYTSLNDFNTNELRRIYDDDNFPSIYEKIASSIDFDTIYYALLKQRISIKDETLSQENVDTDSKDSNSLHFSTEEARQLFILNNSNLPFHFSCLVDDVLNELEQICMNISSQAAGSRYIYQSLHQVFLRTIRTLYIEISLKNNNLSCDKYYTNIIHVYKEWTLIYKKDFNKEQKKLEKVNKILNPKIKTV